jgi:hypothetical protein
VGNLLNYESMTASASEVDWARLASFIDGEGTIYINKSARRKATFSPRYFLSVSITNSSPLLMDWLKRIFFGTVYLVKNSSPLTKKVMMRWQLNERQAQTVLEKCLPYFVVKREQAEIGLAFMRLRSENWSRKKVSDEVLAVRESYRLQIHEANQRSHAIQ